MIKRDLTATARTIYAETLRRLDIRSVLKRKIRRSGSSVQVGSARYEIAAFRNIQIVALGKAAVPMVDGLLDVLQPALQADQSIEGVVIGAGVPPHSHPQLLYRVGSHPLPDSDSIDAAHLILRLLDDASEDTLVFFLISGGASAMVELPLAEEISLAELIGFYQGLLHSGLTITQMNTLRKHLSAVKGGRLALAAAPATQCTLLVSDVPPGQEESVGSGPSLPDPSTLSACRRLLASGSVQTALPPSIFSAFASDSLPETPKAHHPAFARTSVHTLLSGEDLCEVAQMVAQEHGFRTVVDLTCDEWSAGDAAAYLLGRLREFAGAGVPACVISGGELSVRIAGGAGIGGRNQQFALECARQIAGSPDRIGVLSAGSDGLDGNSPAAGAVVDTTTVDRALAQGFVVDHAISAFDAYPLLQAIGDTIVTGPSGNNLRDLRLSLQVPGA